MNAIETVYRGYRFRSRLEARYAVLFDELHFDWSYEPEGFQLDSGLYLPDFHVRDLPFWLEVKGTTPTTVELNYARDLCAHTHEDVWVCDGDLMHFDSDEIHLAHKYYWWSALDAEELTAMQENPADFGLESIVRQAVVHGGIAAYLPLVLPGHLAHLWNRSLLELVRAADKMRSARFEYGEAPPRSSLSS